MEQSLPTRWLTFWSLIRIPLGAGVALWMAYSVLGEPKVSPVAENIGVAFLLLMWFLLRVGAGLRSRRAWALEENQVLIFGEPVLFFLLSIHPQATASLSIAYCFGAFIGLIALWLAWSWPNYIYFKRREKLFH